MEKVFKAIKIISFLVDALGFVEYGKQLISIYWKPRNIREFKMKNSPYDKV